MAKILYIAGWGRSGTTVLGNLLGQYRGFESVGEVHQLWRRGLVDGRLCGCGQPILDCAWWRGVLARLPGGPDGIDAKAIIDSQANLKTRGAGSVLRAQRNGELPRWYAYATYLKWLYDAIEIASGARVIVDSSKFPTDAIVAAGLPGHEVYVLHMVRDPRAVAYSWRRRKASPGKIRDGGLLERVGSVRSSAVWVLYNRTISRQVKAAVGSERYRMVQYEQFAADPERVLAQVLDLVGEPAVDAPEFDGHSARLRMSHTASGNPGRFSSGRVEIRPDEEWARQMSLVRQVSVATLSLPALRASGYRWRHGSGQVTSRTARTRSSA